jgi:hypothetical protein
LGSEAETIPVNAVVVGRATDESASVRCGAGRDRMTSLLGRLVGKPLAALDRLWGP